MIWIPFSVHGAGARGTSRVVSRGQATGCFGVDEWLAEIVLADPDMCSMVDQLSRFGPDVIMMAHQSPAFADLRVGRAYSMLQTTLI